MKGDEKAWNDFVSKARNATFLFNRNYMDYHSDRFTDHSLLIFEDQKLSALFVANEDGNVIQSHGGLTYGGMVVEGPARMEDVLRYFYHTLKYYSTSFSTIVYKCFPLEFMRSQSQDDLYALFLLKAGLTGRLASSVYFRQTALPYHRSKRETTNKNHEFSIARSNDPKEFWTKVLIPNLRDRFAAAPVHSVEEIGLLMSRFPSNIHLFEIRGSDILGGAIVYEMEDVVHTQYLSATAEGRKVDALDVLIDHLLMNEYSGKSKFSFGTSNEDLGRKLNKGLIAWKEGFGARAMIHDVYRVDTSMYKELGDYE